MKLIAESTVFNDEKVRSKFSELIVDADGIRTEVGKKVGNTEVISRINQSAESVKIQANKVNIEGAAIFTGSGRLSTTSLNATYDVNGAATGAVNTLKNDLSSASGTTVIDGGHIATNSIGANKIKVDEIKIGAAQIASGTINVARIPDLSAEKIKTGTISIARIPSTARNDTYITDIDSQNGIIVKAVNGKTDGSDDTKKNYIKLNASGLDIYQGGNSVAQYGATARIGKDSSNHISIDSTNGMQVFTGTESASTNVAQFGSSVRIGRTDNSHILFPAHTSSSGDNAYSEIIFNYGSNEVGRLKAGLSDYGVSYIRLSCRNDTYLSIFETSGTRTIETDCDFNQITLRNDASLYAYDSDDVLQDIVRLDTGNALVLGYGNYTKNAAGYNAWLEGYNVYLRARQKCYANGSQITTSDKRLKKDIVPISDKFKSLFMDLKPIEYRMEQSEDKDIHLGLTAQDVEMAFMKNNVPIEKYALVDEYEYPEEKTRYKALAYTELIPMCIQMIQSQQKELDTLKGELNALRSN